MKRSLLLFILLFVFGPLLWAAEHPVPRVVVSIKPLHSLVMGVMAGAGEPQLLVEGAGSPHGYVMRPSEARMLAEADLVIWVGESLESFMERPLATLGRSAVQLELATRLADRMLPIREGGTWERHDADHEAHGHTTNQDHHAQEDTGHAHQEHDRSSLSALDPHIWTGPLMAQRIVSLVAEALAQVDPSRQRLYRDNAVTLISELDQLYREISQQLAPVRDIPYIVFHDAYQYFETDFGLNAIGSVMLEPERTPGVRRVMEVRDKIVALQAQAVFSEPQFESRLVATIIEGSTAKAGVLDPLGVDLPAGRQTYFTLIRRLAENLCATLQQ